MAKVTAIVPATNRPPTLSVCVAAIQSSEDPPEELLVVDEPPRASPAAARNAGARRAMSDILVFVDADVVLHADAISRIRARFEADPQLVAVFGSYDENPPPAGVVSTFRNLLHHHVHQHAAGPATTFWSGIGAVRRADFLELGGFDEQRFQHASVEDIELGMRLAGANRRIELDPAIQGTHLKRWNLRGMLYTDLFRRGVPWVDLLLDSRSSSTTLNLGWLHRLSAACSVAAVAALAIGRRKLASFLLLAIVAINHPFYRLLVRRQGPRRATVGVGLHVLHHLTGVVAVPVALIQRSLRQARRRDG